MKTKHSLELKKNDLLRKRLAKFMALQCFRNSELEDLHAGKVPQSATGDFSDIKVIFPEGEIPWNEVSRLNDREMKHLMINVVDRCNKFLEMLFTNDSHGDRLIAGLLDEDLLPEWQDPISTILPRPSRLKD